MAHTPRWYTTLTLFLMHHLHLEKDQREHSEKEREERRTECMAWLEGDKTHTEKRKREERVHAITRG